MGQAARVGCSVMRRDTLCDTEVAWRMYSAKGLEEISPDCLQPMADVHCPALTIPR